MCSKQEVSNPRVIGTALYSVTDTYVPVLRRDPRSWDIEVEGELVQAPVEAISKFRPARGSSGDARRGDPFRCPDCDSDDLCRLTDGDRDADWECMQCDRKFDEDEWRGDDRPEPGK
jgi:hypothetical protein